MSALKDNKTMHNQLSRWNKAHEQGLSHEKKYASTNERIFCKFFLGVQKTKTSDDDVVRAFADNFALPRDYKDLLKFTDGFVLFHAGDYAVYDISFVIELKKGGIYKPDFKDEMLTIGYFMGYNLLLNQSEIHTKNYLYAGDACSYNQYVSVGSLTDFLNGFIDTRGEYFPFWEVDDTKYISFERT